MLKLLIKKQFSEIFRQYFYDFKKNKSRSKGAIAAMFVLLAVLLFGMVGGMVAFFAYSIVPAAAVGYGWFYFAIFGLVGIVFGVIGSVFNTYSGLYLAKDNDLLLSMPIPARTLVAARTLGVFLMGLLYSGAVTLPAVIIYWVFVPQTVLRVVGSILFILIVAVIDFVLSCLLGWVVAKISLKLKNRSYITVIISIAFITLYYIVYFKAMNFISDFIVNLETYGDKVKGSAYPLYLFGRVGEGDPKAMAIFLAASIIVVVLTALVLSATFLKIATTSADNANVKFKDKKISEKSLFGTLVSKEFARFKSSSTYMLNCSLSTLLLPAFGVFLLIKGSNILPMLGSMFTSFGGAEIILVTALICLVASMNTVTTPSVSLEGSSLWVVRSLPVAEKQVLRAKLVLHVLLTSIPTLICSVCAVIGLKLDAAGAAVVIALPLVYSVMMAALGLVIGLSKANLNWTREIIPIKQSFPMFISMMLGFAIPGAYVALYLLALSGIGAILYSAIFLALFILILAASVVWLDKSGAKKFAEL